MMRLHPCCPTKHITKIREALSLLPPPPAKFTLSEWGLTNELRTRSCIDQQRLADAIISDCDRNIDEIQERCEKTKKDVEKSINDKIKDVEFKQNEANILRKEMCKELEALETYSARIKEMLVYIGDHSLEVCKKCLIQRERRLGIDLCYDEVERELKREYHVIEGSTMMLNRTLQQASEQIRRIRSIIYFIDRDLADKDITKNFDNMNLSLRNTSLNLSLYHGFAPLDPSNITNEEWEKFSLMNQERASKETNSARQLRTYVDTILRNAIEDLLTQYNATNNAFRRRIQEQKDAKTRMEVQHSEVMRQANEMIRCIVRIEKSLSEREGYMALAHTRLGNRAQRQGVELCKDLVEMNLSAEVAELRQNCFILQQRLAEAQASLRYLLKTQIQLEEDINLKVNSLKIDEVDCMSLRQGLQYHKVIVSEIPFSSMGIPIFLPKACDQKL